MYPAFILSLHFIGSREGQCKLSIVEEFGTVEVINRKIYSTRESDLPTRKSLGISKNKRKKKKNGRASKKKKNNRQKVHLILIILDCSGTVKKLHRGCKYSLLPQEGSFTPVCFRCHLT